MSNTYLLLIPILICVLGAILSSFLFKKDEKKNPFYQPLRIIFTFIGIYIAINFLKKSISISPTIEAAISKGLKIVMIILIAKGFGDGLH